MGTVKELLPHLVQAVVAEKLTEVLKMCEANAYFIFYQITTPSRTLQACVCNSQSKIWSKLEF